MTVVLGWLSGCRIVIRVVVWLGVGGIYIGIVSLILTSVVGCPSVRQVHWYLDVVVRWSWSIGGVVGRSLLILLGVSPPRFMA
jgi:hypothetical protein